MKTVVYNSWGQYALSRKEVEIIHAALPREAWAGIAEFHLCHSHPRKCEMFEFDVQTGIAYFIAPLQAKARPQRDEAIQELLIGLARVQAGSRFFTPLKDKERRVHEEFAAEWVERCLHAVEQ